MDFSFFSNLFFVQLAGSTCLEDLDYLALGDPVPSRRVLDGLDLPALPLRGQDYRLLILAFVLLLLVSRKRKAAKMNCVSGEIRC